MGTLLRSRHLTPCECGQCPPGGTDLSTPICICTNIGKCSFSDIYALCQWKRMLIKGTVYFIELGKHWHPSFPMKILLCFALTALLLVGVNINTLIPLLAGHSRPGWEPVSHYNISEGNYGQGWHSEISFVLQYARHILCTYPYTLLHCIYFTTVGIFPPSFHILCTHTLF